MGKAKMLGMPTKYVPNNRAEDHHRKAYRRKDIPDTEKPKKKPADPKHPVCMFNEGVSCTSYSSNYSLLKSAPTCEKCGWNPAVQKARNEKLSSKLGIKR